MPQLSLYVDESTLRKLEAAAKLEHVSISKYVVQRLNEIMDSSWPKSYEKLFGSIQDETFRIDHQSDFSEDSPRESL